MSDMAFFNLNFPDYDELSQMNVDKLTELLKTAQNQIELLDEKEPEDMMSEEYEVWGEQHEVLEDFIEIVTELLDERI